MAISVPIAAAVVGAGATLYSAHEAKKTAEEQMSNADQLAAQAQNNKISLPNTGATSASVQSAQQQAASAGGTITNPGGLQIGDASNASKKTLLGS